MDRLFVEREVFLRVDGRVRYLRLSRRFQECMGVAAIGLLGWMAYASGSYLVHSHVVASKNQEIQKHRLAYVDLLGEVSGYHDQFSRLTKDLEGNQAYLLSLLEEGEEGAPSAEPPRPADSLAATASSGSPDDPAELRDKFTEFEQDLRIIADRNVSLRDEVSKMRDALRDSRDQRQQVLAARQELGARLRDVEGELDEVTEARDELQTTVADLNQELRRSRSEREALLSAEAGLRRQIDSLKSRIDETSERETALNARIGELEDALAEEVARAENVSGERDEYEARVARLEAQIAESVEHAESLGSTISGLEENLASSLNQAAELKSQRDYYEARVVSLEQRLQNTSVEGQQLDRTIADLRSSLAETEASNQELQAERDYYEERVAALEAHLASLRDTQSTIVQRLTDRTLVTVETMEKTLAMTGLDVGSLLADQSLHVPGLDQGGPFMPGDYISETEPSDLVVDASLDSEAGFEDSEEESDMLFASVRVLDMQMTRWEALQEIFRRLPLIAPVDHYRQSSGFGTRVDPVNGRKSVHHGLDLAAPARTPVLSTAPGRIVFAGWRGRYGRMIEIDHGLGIKTRYAHLKKILVEPGQEVSHREKIGLVGSSGRSTGPHVHYEILVEGQPYDPGKFLKAGRNVFKG